MGTLRDGCFACCVLCVMFTLRDVYFACWVFFTPKAKILVRVDRSPFHHCVITIAFS